MKTRFYAGIGTLAVLAAVFATSQGVRQATADETNPDSVTQSSQSDANPLNSPNQSDQLRTTETRQYGQRDSVTLRDHAKVQSNAFKASELIGMNVRGHGSDDDIGSIDDLMISKDGRVIYAAVSFGGFLGIGDKLFAVPLEAIEFVTNEDENYARMDVSEKSLENKKGFNQDNWPQQANRDFVGGLGTRHAERTEVDSDIPR